VNNHASKEDRVEPWEWAAEPSDQTPGVRKEEITGVMYLPGISIPSVSKNRVSSLGLDDARVFDGLPWELRKSLPFNKQAALLSSEAVLLRVGRIPDPVYKKVCYEKHAH
jgi:hypothetical protein